jgi:hypothetical protein
MSAPETFMRIKFHCLVLLLLALPAVVEAQFTFITNNNAITITGYTGDGGDVVIPNTINNFKVTAIASDVFNQVDGLTSVTFGTNVLIIGTNAIFQCQNLTTVVIPGSVTNIGQGPFFDCQSLTTISLSASNVNYSVTNGVLFNKTQTAIIQNPGGAVGTYTIPFAVTNIGEAFTGNNLTSIGAVTTNSFFTNVSGVLFDKNQTILLAYPGVAPGSYIVPTNKSLTVIAGGAFEYATGITSVTLGTNITSIQSFAFYDTANMTAITVNATNAFYSSTNGALFDKNKTVLIQYPCAIGGNYTIPGSVTNIMDGAFGDSFGLTSVVIPNSVVNIGFESFYACENLASVSLGNKVGNITQGAFIFCFALTGMVFPGSVTNLGFEAFYGCQSLSSVCFEGKPPVDGGSIFLFDELTEILYVSGNPGWGMQYDGINTSPCASCGGTTPELFIIPYGTNVILAWSTDFPGYTLQSTTNLTPPIVWSPVSGQYLVTNAITGTKKFYRLSNP